MKKVLDPISKSKVMGIESLTDIELLSILVYSGGSDKRYYEVAKNLMNKFGSFKKLMSQSYGTLESEPGISKRRANQIIAINEISKRIVTKDIVKYSIKTINDIINYLKINPPRQSGEYLMIIFLDSNSLYLNSSLIYKSLESRINADVNEIVRISIFNSARKIIIIHNHPNNIDMPSSSDIDFTNKLLEKLNICNIKLCDHLIKTDHSLSSIMEYTD